MDSKEKPLAETSTTQPSAKQPYIGPTVKKLGSVETLTTGSVMDLREDLTKSSRIKNLDS